MGKECIPTKTLSETPQITHKTYFPQIDYKLSRDVKNNIKIKEKLFTYRKKRYPLLLKVGVKKFYLSD